MTVARSEVLLDDAAVRRALTPRDGVVAERAVGDRRFEATGGPFESYVREVSVEPVEGDGHGDGDGDGHGRFRVRQRVEYRLDVPIFKFLFAPGFRAHLRRVDPLRQPRWPWWHPPARLDQRAISVLSALAALAIAMGYLGTILTQTITYAAAEFGADRGAQGVALALVRADALFTVLLVAAADRQGRRRVLFFTATLGCVLTATGAFVPSLAFLAASQIVSRGFVTAGGVLIGVMAAEEMPAGCRAYAVSLLAMAGALGAGVAVILLPLADFGTRGWRLLFLLALIWLLVIWFVRGYLPETRRFESHHSESYVRGAGGRLGPHTRRLWLLAVSGMLLALFVAPASQFQNEYLRTELGFSASRISLFTLVTNTPGGIGVILGGRLADVRGRRIVAAVGVVGGVGATVLMYLATGWPVWAWSLTGAMVGAAVIPALGVYGPELFPTGQRGRANGIITAFGRIGSVIGLVVTGVLASKLDRIGPALALLAIGPAVLAVLILVAYPETAHRELEDINPEDRVA